MIVNRIDANHGPAQRHPLLRRDRRPGQPDARSGNAGPVARDGQPPPGKSGALAGCAAAAPHDAAGQPQRSRRGSAAAPAPDAGAGRRPADAGWRPAQRTDRQAARDDQSVVRAVMPDAGHRRIPAGAPAHRGRTADRGPRGGSGQRTHRPGRAHHQPAGRRRGGAPPGHLPVGAVRITRLPEATRPSQAARRPGRARLHHACLRHPRGVPPGPGRAPDRPER